MANFSLILSLTCIMFVCLTIIVIKHRRRSKQKLGNTHHDALLEKAIRAHGNFCEVSPFGLASFWLLTQTGLNNNVVLILGVFFLIGRISHSASLLYIEEKFHNLKFRVFGMVSSFVVIIFSTLNYLFYHFA